MGKSKIEWCDRTWNPVTGCTKISPGCANCYAERISKRLAGRCGYPEDDPFTVTFHPERLDEPLKWRKPSRVFVCSMSDIFHDKVEPIQLGLILNTIKKCPQHTFMILTKRPEIMKDHFYSPMLNHFFGLKNLWLGVTAENQEQANKRIPVLLQIPAAVRFVSVEPMLSPVDISLWFVSGYMEPPHDDVLNLVICGGESGPGARPLHPDWARSLRDQCQGAGVPFLFKQWGEWLPQKEWLEQETNPDAERNWVRVDGRRMYRVGKKSAGRLLDGRTWDEYPEVST